MRRGFSDSLVSYQTPGLSQSQHSSSAPSTSNQSGTSQLNARNSSEPPSSAATGAGFELESGSRSREEATDDGTNVEARSDGQLKEDERGVKWRLCENCEKWISLGSNQGSQYAFSELGSCRDLAKRLVKVRAREGKTKPRDSE